MEKLIKIKSIKKIGKRKTLDFKLVPHEIYKVNGVISHNCHNLLFQKFNYGVEWEINDLVEYIKDRIHWIDGITLSGGDPMFQPDLKEFLKSIRNTPELNKINIIMYTGYNIDEIPSGIKLYVDIIIDGKYDESLPPTKWRGSSNQKYWKKVTKTRFKEMSFE